MSFKSGVRVEQTPNQIADIASDFAQQADSYPGTTVGTVRGRDAVLVEPGTEDVTALEPAPGGVEFVESDVLIDVVGNGEISLDELIEVAESLEAYSSAA